MKCPHFHCILHVVVLLVLTVLANYNLILEQ